MHSSRPASLATVRHRMSDIGQNAGQNAGHRTNAGLPTESDLVDVALEYVQFWRALAESQWRFNCDGRGVYVIGRLVRDFGKAWNFPGSG